MGQLIFDVPEPARRFVEESLWREAYVCGIEGIPWRCRCVLGEHDFRVSRSIDSSGKLSLACRVPDVGWRTLATCSLRVGGGAYSLIHELARGSCFRARVQSDGWQRAGLLLPEAFCEALRVGTSRFIDSLQSPRDCEASINHAIAAITALEQAVDLLGDAYIDQSVAFRSRGETRISTLLAAAVVPPSPSEASGAARFAEAFNTAAVRLNWSEIESDAGRYDYVRATQTLQWCAANGIRVIGGPLIDFRERLMPHFLYLMEDDFDSLFAAVKQYVERTVTQLRGTVQLWNCAAGLNTPGPIDLTDEQTVRLAIGILEVVRRCDPDTPAIMTFDQPFGEHLAKHDDAISPLHFADALCRTGLGLAGIGLELRVGAGGGFTLPRSAVDVSNLVDRWATLGLPLMVQLGVPAGTGDDPSAIIPDDAEDPSKDPATVLGILNADDQMRVAVPMVRALLAKHVVHGIVWNGWADDRPHVDRHSGLVDADGDSRPLLDYLADLRREFLE